MTDRDTPVTALREAVAAYIDALDDGAHPERVVPSLRALRAALASSDDVAGSAHAMLREFAALRVGIDDEIAASSDQPDAFEQGSLAAYNYVLSHWPDSDDVAGSGERLALEQMRREHADHTTEFRCAGCAALLRVDAAAPTTEAPPRDAPE